MLCCFALFVNLFELACFFLPSFSSLIKTYVYMYIMHEVASIHVHVYVYMYIMYEIASRRVAAFCQGEGGGVFHSCFVRCGMRCVR